MTNEQIIDKLFFILTTLHNGKHSENAVEILQRIIQERNKAQKAIKTILKTLKGG